MILPRPEQQAEPLQLWQKWHMKTSKTGSPEKGRTKTLLAVYFFTYNCSLLFTKK